MNSIDFSLCEQERIHIPGYIQPHGYTLSFKHDSLAITSISSNISNAATYINHSIRDWLEPNVVVMISEWFENSTENQLIIYKQAILVISPTKFDLYLYRSKEEIVLELIPINPEEISICELVHLSGTIENIVKQQSVQSMCEQAAFEVRQLSGFDRVMVYRFDEEYNGCVIAEEKDDKLFPYLGLNYPASDIPAQARELYQKNLIRCIIDTDYTPVSILRNRFLNDPLDMTFSYLRSVSPVHIEYLHNMGVQSTMTISIIINNQLWGLIACHHQTPLQHPLKLVLLIESFGKIFSSVLNSHLENDQKQRKSELYFKLEGIIENIQIEKTSLSLFSILSQHHKIFDTLFQADGFSLMFHDQFICTSTLSSYDEMRLLIDAIHPFLNEGSFVSHHLAANRPELDPYLLQKYAGIFVIEVMGDYWIWFRHEKKQTLTWGGNPNEKGYINQQGGISPRTSFEAFQEIVRFRSDPWQQAEIEFIEPFQSMILHLIEWYDSKKMVFTQQESLDTLEEEKSLHYKQLLESLVDLIEQRDAYTAGHTRRVAIYCDLIAKELGFSIDDRNTLYEASILHDIGKVVVPDAILLKPGRLDSNEYELIKSHLNIGFQILNKINYYRPLANIIRFHHEKYDGSGYPDGVMGDDIPLASHIMIVADAIDAMTSNRIYQPRRTMKEACEEILKYRAIWYHPIVVDAVLSAFQTTNGEEYTTQLPVTSIERARFSYFFKDQLTGVYNETYLGMILHNEIPEVSYRGYLLVEIKEMTQYNTQYGWHEGDKIIQKFVNILALARSKEHIFRVFGDDFIIGYSDHFQREHIIHHVENNLFELKYGLKLLTNEELDMLL